MNNLSSSLVAATLHEAAHCIADWDCRILTRHLYVRPSGSGYEGGIVACTPPEKLDDWTRAVTGMAGMYGPHLIGDFTSPHARLSVADLEHIGNAIVDMLPADRKRLHELLEPWVRSRHREIRHLAARLGRAGTLALDDLARMVNEPGSPLAKYAPRHPHPKPRATSAASRLRSAPTAPAPKQLSGYVVAERGEFKSGRGRFDDESLRLIVRLLNQTPGGLKSHFGHPPLFGDALGTFLGRATNARLDDGKVRADLHFDPSAFHAPRGDLAGYVLRLSRSDPDALSSSLLLQFDEVADVDPATRRPRVGRNGAPSAPVWRPTRLLGSDIVDEGDAVHGALLSVNPRRPTVGRALVARACCPLTAVRK